MIAWAIAKPAAQRGAMAVVEERVPLIAIRRVLDDAQIFAPVPVRTVHVLRVRTLATTYA